jgi:hypothetical protein
MRFIAANSLLMGKKNLSSGTTAVYGFPQQLLSKHSYFRSLLRHYRKRHLEVAMCAIL